MMPRIFFALLLLAIALWHLWQADKEQEEYEEDQKINQWMNEEL